MRIIVAVVLFLAALLAIAASMGMNWAFWTAQGANAEMSRVLGAVSITVDIFKAVLPMVIVWAWAERLRHDHCHPSPLRLPDLFVRQCIRLCFLVARDCHRKPSILFSSL